MTEIKTIKNEFKIEDYVKLSKASPYFKSQGNHEVGTVVNVEPNGIVHIDFFDGYQNIYHINDLELIDKSNYVKPIIPIPTIGTDPELEIYDEFGFINANTILTSRTDVPVGTDGNSNIAEIRPKEGKTALELADNIGDLIKKLKFKCDEKFGRDTNYIIRAGNGKRMSLGGHIHFGILKKQRQEAVDALDFLSMAISTIYTRKYFKIRTNSSYGKLGDVRDQPWGFEYRTLPSYIIDRETTEQILCSTHCIAIDFLRGDLKDNLYFKRLMRWYDKYRQTIRTKYEQGEEGVFDFKLKTIYKMVTHTKAYNEMEGYKPRVDRLFERIFNKVEINESGDVISNWNLKNCMAKSKVTLFKFSEDEYLDTFKIKKNTISIQAIDRSKYETFPIWIYGLKKDRNIDVAVSNDKLYRVIKKFAKNNKLSWNITTGSYSQSNTGTQIGLSMALRNNCKDNLLEMFEYIIKEVN